MGAQVNSPRRFEVQLTPRLVPVSYSSARVIDSNGSVALHLPTDTVATEGGERLNVPSEAAEKLLSRYVYVFATGRTLEEVAETLPEETTKQLLTKVFLRSQSRTNHLVRLLRVTGASSYEIATGDEVQQAFSRKSEPQFSPTSTSFVFPTIPGLRFRTWGSPHLLDEAALDTLLKELPEEADELDLLSPRLPTFDLRMSGEASAKHVLPVLDPLIVLRGVTQKYNDACDAYLAHIGDFRPREGDDTSDAAGAVAFFKYQVASLVTQLTENAVQDVTAAERARNFAKRYEERRTQLREAREETAHDVIRWLESESMRVLDKVLRKSDGAFVRVTEQRDGKSVESYPYQHYVHQVALAQARLAESDRGRAYLFEVLSNLASATGARRIISSFILPSGTPDVDTVKIARGAAGPLFSLWGQLFPLVAARVAHAVSTYKVGPEQYVALNEAAGKLCQQIAYLFDDPILDVVHHKAIDLQILIQDKLALLHVEQVELRLVPRSAPAALAKLNIAAAFAEGALQAINAALALGAIREAIRKEKLDVEAWTSGLNLAQSLVFAGDKLQQASALKRLRDSIFGARPASVISTRLTMLGAAFDLAAAAPSAVAAYQQHDWNKSFAEATKGVGAVVTMAALAFSGPVGLIALGFALGIGGSIWSDLATDNPYDKLVKFSAFGAWSPTAKMLDDDRAWTLANSYEDWNPHTKSGLETHLGAANQMQFSFRAQGHQVPLPGPLASDAGLRIIASRLLPSSVFYLDIEGDYVLSTNPQASAGPKLQGQLVIQFSDDVTSATLTDSTNLLQTSKVLKVSRDPEGHHVVDLGIRLRNPPTDKPLTINHLTIKLRLDVLGDGTSAQQGADGSIVVPRMKGGAKKLVAVVLKERVHDRRERRTYTREHLA